MGIKKEKDLFLDFFSLETVVALHKNMAEEQCITKVLTAYLKRKPIDEDFKDCTMITVSDNSKQYILAHKSTKLGMVTCIFKEGSFIAKFNPEVISF